MIGTSLAHYSITAAIGRGGMGEVYRANDSKLRRNVAIKVLPPDLAGDPERLARFRREAQFLASLDHPNIGAIYGLEEVEGRPFLVLELVEGEDLTARLRRGPVPVDEARQLARQIAEALEEAREKGIVHRDLKPANIKVSPDGRVKVLDFGLAKVWTGEGSGASLQEDASLSPTLTYAPTTQGVVLGTAAYMSPEQARGGPVDRRTDIWAFGVVMWEMLTGRRLFTGATTSDVLAAVLTRELDWTALAPGAQGRVRQLLRRCLERNPKQRIHDIADVRILLEEIGSPASAGAEIAGTVAGAPTRMREGLMLGAVAAMAIISAALGWALLSDRAPAGDPARYLSVVLPENLWLVEDSSGAVAISADGRRLAVLGQDDSAQRIYVRDLGSPELKELPGTEGAGGPFFSPDGRWLAFSKSGLKKLSLDGGAPVPVAPTVFGSGAWGPSGRIYYTPQYNTGLARVDASGGAPEELSRPDRSQGELNHAFPDLLPGERALLFTSFRMPLAESRVEALVLATGERHVVVDHAIGGHYLGAGYLTFVRDERLMVAPFDIETLRLTGPVMPSRQDVAVSYAFCHAEYALSADGTLAFVPRSVLPARREVVRLDHSGRSQTILPGEETYTGPALSPDGRRIALTRNKGELDLLLYDLERRVTTRLAASPRSELGAVRDPSGTRVFFVVAMPPFQMFEAAVGGTGDPRRLLESAGDQIPQDVSPDGKWLLYLDTADADQPHLAILTLDRPEEARQIPPTSGVESGGAFSPDGRYIVFQSSESGRNEIYVRGLFDAARWVPVTSVEASSLDGRRRAK